MQLEWTLSEKLLIMPEFNNERGQNSLSQVNIHDFIAPLHVPLVWRMNVR